MTVTLAPAPLGGTVAAVPSKSAAHRHLICAALADGPTRIVGAGRSEDVGATLRCLKALGTAITAEGDTLTVTPGRAPPQAVLDCGESGSTLRFLLPLAAALCGSVRAEGRGRLPHRPLEDLIAALEGGGVACSPGGLPLTTRGRLKGGVFRLPGDISSQYVSGLLLALPGLRGDSEIRLNTPLESAGYVDMTLGTLAAYGVSIHAQPWGFAVPGGQQFRSPGEVRIEGDWSGGAFFLAAGAIGGRAAGAIGGRAAGAVGGPVTVTGLRPDSPQGDRQIVHFLRQLGAVVHTDGHRVTAVPATLRGCVMDMRQTPDLLPPLAVVAACAAGESRFIRAARLRYKESDRLEAAARLIRDLGGAAEAVGDSLRVKGGGLRGGETGSFGDHRMAMAAAVAATACREPVTLTGAQAADKSYPGFFDDYRRLQYVI